MNKKIQFKVKGMHRDLSASSFSPDFAYENMNMRIMPSDDSTLLSLINERGNKFLTNIEGQVIGQAVLNDTVILFVTGINGIDQTKTDGIYKITVSDGTSEDPERLYYGNLDFSPLHPIETIVYYENEKIQKVYWTDGVNQPRVINIAADSTERAKWNDDYFNFIRKIKLEENISIAKSNSSNGVFHSGVIQYAFSYYNLYGQESNIFYVSPLYYISHVDRGGSPDENLSNSFNITISGNVDGSFDYIRIYSIARTSINGTPEVRRVADLSLRSGTQTGSTLSFIDTGNIGDIIDPTLLLYIGGETASFETISHKDNTLFLGNIKLNRPVIDETIRDYLKTVDVTYSVDNQHTVALPAFTGYYPYKNQLNKNSSQIKTFKYLEWYRFGVQFQHKTGKWSEPIFIKDKRNTSHITFSGTDVELPFATSTIDNAALHEGNLFDLLISEGYVKVRPVIVYPELKDREAICQGVLCPTVYNVEDRYGNSPFVQSSWFTRPNIPEEMSESLVKNAFKIKVGDSGLHGYFDKKYTYSKNNKTYIYHNHDIEEEQDPQYPEDPGAIIREVSYVYLLPQNPVDWNDTLEAGGTFTPISATGSYESFVCSEITRTTVEVENTESPFKNMDVNKGSIAEFRHNAAVPGNTKSNAEIQCIYEPPYNPEISTSTDIFDYLSNNKENFYIDQSIVTLHSPDIEFDDSISQMDTVGLKLRIVGIVPLTAFSSDIDIQTSTPAFLADSKKYSGFYKEPIGVEHSNWSEGYRCMMAAPFWIDTFTKKQKGQEAENIDNLYGFVVYPWQKNGSLNDCREANAATGAKSAVLSKKKMSNLRFSYKSSYFSESSIWKGHPVSGTADYTGISDPVFFNNENGKLIKIKAPSGSNLNDINYYGDIDKLISYSKAESTASSNSVTVKGYPIVISNVYGKSTDVNFISPHSIFAGRFTVARGGADQMERKDSFDPVRIKYKSSPHAVIALDYYDRKQVILPTIENTDASTLNDRNTSLDSNTRYFWSRSNMASNGVIQDTIDIPYALSDSVAGGWLWMGELYRDNVVNRFGGDSPEAIENNTWIPCGEAKSILNTTSVTLNWIEGDTYYQRYDHLKTYPVSIEDQNAMVDIISFMCETKVNLDGRYDRNRGLVSNLVINNENFNKLNKVYSQNNNFFNFRGINLERFSLDRFPNSLTWTKTKSAGEVIDTWTNVTIANILDLDGDKGDIRAIRRLNNNLIAFQDIGISQIMYNENMQIASTEGVPIEIANSGKVNGKRYLSDSIGCTNKWSICETPNGLYFIDDISKGIYLFDGKLNNLSDKYGFHSWINKNLDGINIWNPSQFNGFVSYYDNTNGDVLFINKDNCLAFSEPLGQFSSFYSYDNMPYFINVKDIGIDIVSHPDSQNKGFTSDLWLHNKGDYNYFFGEYKPYSVTVIANPEPDSDKVFNTLEFRSDSFNFNIAADKWKLSRNTFDTLDAWNEYQNGSSKLAHIIGRPSNLKQKFRIWRANIPRDRFNNRDRMRNPWLYIKLSRNNANKEKTVLHDMTVDYFI